MLRSAVARLRPSHTSLVETMPAACTTSPPCASPAPTILVADDQPDVALVLTRLLEAFGYRVVGCHSTDEALQILASRGDIALVLSDIRMPGRDGLALARLLRVRFPALPVLLMSGMADSGGETMPDGIAVLPKPIDPATLERIVRERLAPPV